MRFAWILLCLIAAAPAPAQAQSGVAGGYTVRGSEGAWGDYEGQLEVRRVFAGLHVFEGTARFSDGRRALLDGRLWASADSLYVQVRLRRRSLRLVSGALRGLEQAARGRLRGDVGSRWEVRRGIARFARVDPERTGLTFAGSYARKNGRGVLRVGSESWTRRTRTVRLKLMTFNILGGKWDWFTREGRIADLIADESPDVVALQEVVGVRSDHSFQASGVAKRAGGYGYAFRGIRSYTRFNVVWAGNAILARGRIRDVELLQLTEGPKDQNPYPRGVIRARVQVAPGLEVPVYSTHLHHRGGEDGGSIRLTQARELLGWLDGKRDPEVILGDFNGTDETRMYRFLTGDGHLVDTWSRVQSGQGPGTVGSGRRIDYVFLGGDPDAVRVVSSHTRGPKTDGDSGRPLSDHRAVVSVVELTIRD